MFMTLIYLTLFACTQMENPGEPFAPVKIVTKKKDTTIVAAEDSDPAFQTTGEVLFSSEPKETDAKKAIPLEEQNRPVAKDVSEDSAFENERSENTENTVQDVALSTPISESASQIPDRIPASTQMIPSTMMQWPLRVVKTQAELSPPRAILGLPNGEEIVVRPGMQLPKEGLVIMGIGKTAVIVAKVIPQGDHAKIESITLPSLND